MKRDPRQIAMLVSLAAAVVMLVGKLTAYFVTHSTAIFSDAAESVVHGVATALAAFSLWYASQPPDAAHPYGHGRIVYFSAGFEGALIAATAIVVVWSGAQSLIAGPEVSHLTFGLTVSAVLAAINLVLGFVLIRVGRKHNALVLVANGKHVLSDMLTTLAAIAGIGLVMLTGIELFDPLAALIIGVFILISGLHLLREAYAGLMDEVAPEILEQLSNELQRHQDAGHIAGFHQLRCRHMNDQLWVDLHVLIPGDVSTREAHRRVTRLEEALYALPLEDELHVTSHIEPADHAAAHPEGHGNSG
jgi:cation diffusion facilitator family transporter